MDIDKLRKEYSPLSLRREDLEKDPLLQLRIWLKEAAEHKIQEPNAMTLATASKEGRPSSRTVLLKELREEGLIFYTNYASRKAQEIEVNPFASVTFWWKEMYRQIIVEGSVEKISKEESDTYFASRPRGAQISAWSSRQDTIVPDRNTLLQQYQNKEQEFGETPISRPEYWGGFLLRPTRFEFWKGRENRLHDRFLYRMKKDTWIIERLSP